MPKKQFIEADDSTQGVSLLLQHRLPWLIVGLILGVLTTLVVANFERLLAAEVRLTFFIPIIVYMSGAVATQTGTIYVRKLSSGHPKFSVYLFKEIVLGLMLGLIFGALLGLFAFAWLGSVQVAAAVGMAMFASIATGTIVALLIPTFIAHEHLDPALGAGPFTTVMLDLISLLIYFTIAAYIIL